MTDLATLDAKAWDRTQRRFRHMINASTYGDPNARSTRLYLEAERLLDRLRGEFGASLREDARMSALFDATHAELWELADADDAPRAVVEGDARAMWGNR